MTLSLNNRDSMEGDDQNLTDLGIVSGDLVYVMASFELSDSAVTDAKSSVPCPPASGSVGSFSSDVATMETDEYHVDGFKAVVNNTGDGHHITSCDGTAPDGPETEQSTSELCQENMDSFATSESCEVDTEAASTGVECAMSAEELQLVNRYLNEPMLVREATNDAIPQTLVLAYSVVRPQTSIGAVIAVIDVLMSELGYQRTTVSEAGL